MTTIKCEVRIDGGRNQCPFTVITVTPAEALLIHQGHMLRAHPHRKPD